jgi:C-terminal processing protease CtpA/Prc
MLRCRFVLALLLFVVLCASADRVPAQVILEKDQAELPLDAKTRAEVIDRLLKEVMDGYVFPKVAQKMRDSIRDRAKNKEYDGVKTGQELAQLLTRHLQDVSRDKHLRVRCSTRKVPPQPKGKPDPKQVERMRGMQKKLNAGFRRVERLAGNIGYLELEGFMHHEVAARPAAAAMSFLADTDALIIDLRRNGGGSPQTVALVCSYLFDEKPVHLNSLYWRKGDRTEEFWTLEKVDGPRYTGKDVYVLTSKRTFSAAEEFTYNLQTRKRAVIVGETTGGGAHPGGMVPLGDHFLVFIPTGRAINPVTKTNWEGKGVKPDIAVPADQALERAHQEAVKKLLAKAKDDQTRRLIQMDLERARERDKARGKKGG